MAKQYAVCRKVIGGTTFETDAKLKIRLARVCAPRGNTPEGIAATNALRDMIEGHRIGYEICDRDEYGNALCEVWLDDLSINDWALAQGYESLKACFLLPRAW